jgi:acylphosphatase
VTIARRVVVRGQVQGVFFRETVRRRAYRAGVAGWVRNNDDGTVEAWFEGEPDDVEVMVHFAGIGPSGAHVESVDVEDAEPAELRAFEVR